MNPSIDTSVEKGSPIMFNLFNIKPLLLISFLGVFMPLLAASDASPQPPLGLLEAWESAIDADTQFKSANASLAAQRELLPQARAALLPSVSTSAIASQVDQEFTSDSNVETSFDGSSTSYSVEFRQPVLDLAALKYYKSAHKTIDVVDLNLLLARQTLVLRLSRAYFGLLLANESKALAESELKAIARQLDQTRQRFKVGLVSKTDVLEAQAAYDQTKVTVARAENDQAIGQENLGIIIGSSVDQIVSLKQTIPLMEMELDIEAWVDTVIKNNIQLKIAQLSQDTAALTRDATKASYWPTIDAFASYSNSSQSSDTEGTAIGVQATWVPFQGGGLRSRIREAELKFQSAATDTAGLQKTMGRDARNAYKTLATDIVSIKAQTQAALSTESALEATKAGYEVGTRNVVDVLDAQRAVFRAKRDLTQARHQWILDRFEAAYLDSSLSLENIQEVDSWLVL